MSCRRPGLEGQVGVSGYHQNVHIDNDVSSSFLMANIWADVLASLVWSQRLRVELSRNNQGNAIAIASGMGMKEVFESTYLATQGGCVAAASHIDGYHSLYSLYSFIDLTPTTIRVA